jgi:hypothetical protein
VWLVEPWFEGRDNSVMVSGVGSSIGRSWEILNAALL